MLLVIAAICLALAACCSMGLDVWNRKQKWWASGQRPNCVATLNNVPIGVRKVFFLHEALVSISFVVLAFWASQYEKEIGRLPILTSEFFFIAFVNGSISIALLKKVRLRAA